MDTGGGLRRWQMDCYYGDDEPLGPGHLMARPRGTTFEYAYAAAHFAGYIRASHNIYLGMVVELGITGILLLLATLIGHYLLTANGHRADPDESSRLRLTSYEAAFWGLLMCGFFPDLFWEEYFWFALMLLVMGVRVRQLRQSNSLPAMI